MRIYIKVMHSRIAQEGYRPTVLLVLGLLVLVRDMCIAHVLFPSVGNVHAVILVSFRSANIVSVRSCSTLKQATEPRRH